jgi:hypothetical protein
MKCKKKDRIRIITCTYKTVPFMLCPKCHGQGSVCTPINTPYNSTYVSTSASFICDVCDGQKIIPMVVIPDKK